MSERARSVTAVGEEVQLGVVQLHPQRDLRDEFYGLVDDLRASAATVDVWFMDIANLLEDHGYEMVIRRVE